MQAKITKLIEDIDVVACDNRNLSEANQKKYNETKDYDAVVKALIDAAVATAYEDCIAVIKKRFQE